MDPESELLGQGMIFQFKQGDQTLDDTMITIWLLEPSYRSSY